MATLGQNSSRTVLKGLSSFWLRFFNDKETLESLYTATDQLMGQLYLQLMEALLCNSIDTVPVFSKEFWKLITFDSSTVEVIGVEYRFLLPDKIRKLNFIYNTIFEPSIIMESNKDYRIEGDYIYFIKNIFDDLEYPGLAKRRSGSTTIISMWCPEADVDKEYIYEHYGRMLKIYEPSSEAYKSFIKGIWFYYMNGPTINRITSALNIIGGYPVASEDGEIVLSIKNISGINYIKTTSTVYEIADNVGLIINEGDVLRAFQFLTDAYTVTDYIDDPNWFDNIIVPVEILPSLTVDERTTNRHDLDPIFIGYPTMIGDPEWRIGMGGMPNFMWLFFNGVLKYNIFYVTYNAIVSKFVRSINDLVDIVLSGKPAYTLALVVPYIKLSDTVSEVDEDRLYFEIEHSLSNSYLYTDIDESLALESEMVLPDETYGEEPISFGDSPTLIGSGLIGDEIDRIGSGVPVLIGIDTLGSVSDGLYSEFPLEIVVE